ncbi:MAG: pyrroline-5-carboxylate reductase [Desulfobacterales bacterium]|nr:pyrroline-5-carboxylate reductase [Desulfobacterales bacterium]
MSEIKGKVGFIGAGNMGEAIIGAIIRSSMMEPAMINIYDVNQERLEYMHSEFGVSTKQRLIDLFMDSRIVIFSVKPQQIGDVLSQIVESPDFKIEERKIVISIAAGVPLITFENRFYGSLGEDAMQNLPIIRVMPNTPALVLEGMSGMSSNRFVSVDDRTVTREILSAMGSVIELDEGKLDAVTALSGSGPAYVFYVIESMIKAGISVGLDAGDAATLTIQTFKGAIKLYENSSDSAEELRRKVTSPGGTTEAAIKVLDKEGVKQNIIDAVIAAADRSKELRELF